MADNDNFSYLRGLALANLFNVCANGCVWCVLSGAKMGGLEAILNSSWLVLTHLEGSKNAKPFKSPPLLHQSSVFVSGGAQEGPNNFFFLTKKILRKRYKIQGFGALPSPRKLEFLSELFFAFVLGNVEFYLQHTALPGPRACSAYIDLSDFRVKNDATMYQTQMIMFIAFSDIVTILAWELCFEGVGKRKQWDKMKCFLCVFFFAFSSRVLLNICCQQIMSFRNLYFCHCKTEVLGPT